MTDAEYKTAKEEYERKIWAVWCAEHGHEVMPGPVIKTDEAGVMTWPVFCCNCRAGPTRLAEMGPLDRKTPLAWMWDDYAENPEAKHA